MFLAPRNLPLRKYEKKISQPNGVVEEKLIEHIVGVINPQEKFCIELGAGDGTNHSFTRNLFENHGWGGLVIEGDPTLAQRLIEKNKSNSKITALNSFITRENILTLFSTGKVPVNCGFLCIDLDGNDYYIWETVMENYRPQLVCIEYNGGYGPDQHFKIQYDPQFHWRGDDYFGASFATMVELGARFDYVLIHCTTGGDNLFFVPKEIANKFSLWKNSPIEFYQLPQYGRSGRAINGKGHPASPRNTDTWTRLLYRMRYHVMSIPRKVVNLCDRLSAGA